MTAPLEAARGPVLGIDPGTRVLGYGAVTGAGHRPELLEAGVVRLDGRLAIHLRLERIRAELEQLLAEIRPTAVVVERAFAGRNVQSALRLGECRGVVLAAAARSGAQVGELSPAQAKRALAGSGGAGKGQVADLVLARLGLATEGNRPPADASDALALALAWWQGVRGASTQRRAPSAAANQAALARLARGAHGLQGDSRVGRPAAGAAVLEGLAEGAMVLSRRRRV